MANESDIYDQTRYLADPDIDLSPAFDMVPNIGFNREHVLRIGLDTRPPNTETLLAEMKYFGIKRRQQAMGIIEAVHEAVSKWPDIFSKYNVPEKDDENRGKDIGQRLKRTCQ